jgi:hypothetical protein
MKNYIAATGNAVVITINTRNAELLALISVEDLEKAQIEDRYGIFKDKQGRLLARSGKASGQKFLHKQIVEIPKGSTLVWKDGNTLNCQRNNLQLVDREGNVTELQPQKVTEPEYKRHEAREVLKQAHEEVATDYEALEGKHLGDPEKKTGSYAEHPERRTSPVKGVYFHKASQRWNASAFWQGKRYSLGYFNFQEDAELEIKIFRSAGPESPALKRNQPKGDM